MEGELMTFNQGYALLMGIGTYQHHPSLDVPVTSQDARAVAAVLRDPHSCGYPHAQVMLLRDGAATRNAVLTALDALATLDEQATVFLFYTGHGATGADGNYTLTTHDTRVD